MSGPWEAAAEPVQGGQGEAGRGRTVPPPPAQPAAKMQLWAMAARLLSETWGGWIPEALGAASPEGLPPPSLDGAVLSEPGGGKPLRAAGVPLYDPSLNLNSTWSGWGATF